jgi:uncharacterized protein (TIGR04255 family)
MTAAKPMTGLKIDFNERFEHLKNAPIVEAVVSIHARPERQLEEKELLRLLGAKLPDYPTSVSQNESSVTFQMTKDGPAAPAGQILSWKGIRFQSADNLHLAQFNKDGFVFSRLAPYAEWDQLSSEALRLLAIYVEVAQPREIQRIGLRFVNRFAMPAGENEFEKYIRPHPESPVGLELPFAGFFHQDSFAVPGLPYGINIVRTIQQPMPPHLPGVGLIIDTDVFTSVPFEFDLERTKRHLAEMRWLKNKVFFGSITGKSVELFK